MLCFQLPECCLTLRSNQLRVTHCKHATHSGRHTDVQRTAYDVQRMGMQDAPAATRPQMGVLKTSPASNYIHMCMHVRMGFPGVKLHPYVCACVHVVCRFQTSSKC
jgi:hypothetical protein